MDIGRIYVGTAVSDRYLTKTLPLHTFILRSGTEMNVYPQFKEEYDLNMDFFIALNRLIEQYSVKGLIIGYPVSFNKEVNIISIS